MDFTTPAPLGPADTSAPVSLMSLEPTFGEYFEAAAGNVLRDSPVSSIARYVELDLANADRYHTKRTVTPEQANAQAEEAGVKVDFGTAKYTPEAVNLMIQRAHTRHVRDTTIGRYNPNMGTQLGVTLLSSLADPLNLAVGAIPFVGEARYATLLAGAGGAMGRATLRAGIGAAEGAVWTAAMEPLIALSATQEGRDYYLADSMRNVLFGAALGAGLHSAGGAIADKLFKRQFGMKPVETPADIIHRVPEEINEVALRSALADMIVGRPVQAQEMIDAFSRQDPEAARALSYAVTLRGSGPEIEDTLARIGFWKDRLSGRTLKPEGDDFASWVRAQGGLRDADGMLEADFEGGKVDLPSSLYIGKRGASRSTRGKTWNEMFEAAKAEGFVNTEQELRDAFRAARRDSPLRKKYRVNEEERIVSENQDINQMVEAAKANGLSETANNTVKAKAIVELEQQILNEERNRVLTAIDKLLKRNQDYVDEGKPKTAEPQPVEVEKIEPKSTEGTADEEPAPGDEVNVFMGAERVQMNATPLKVERVIDDPVYGKWVYLERSSDGIPLSDIQVVKRSPSAAPEPKPKEGEKAKTTEEAKPEPKKEYTAANLAYEIRNTLRESEKGKVDIEVVRARMPDLSKNKIRALLKEVVENYPGIGSSKGKNNTTVVFFKTLTPDQREQSSMGVYRGKVADMRQRLDALYPSMAKEKTYYLHAFSDFKDLVAANDKGWKKILNEMIKKGEVRAVSEETGETIQHIQDRHFDSDSEGVLLHFTKEQHPKIVDEPAPEGKQPISGSVKTRQASAIEQVPTQRVVENPPADRDAMTADELNKAAEQYKQLTEQNRRRLNQLLPQIDAETANAIRAQLDQIDGDAKGVTELYEQALTCLLRGPKK